MKFMALLKFDESAPFGPPPPELQSAMGVYIEEGLRSGKVVELGGLRPSEAGAIVSLVDGTIKAVDGPFTEARGRPPDDADPRRPLAGLSRQLRGPAGRRPGGWPRPQLTRRSTRGRAVV